jgi:hypothetical protein
MNPKPKEMTDLEYEHWKDYLREVSLHIGKNGGRYYIKYRENGTAYRSYV